ncbi:uncharacterized protein LOC129583067 isoform X2 [Paramacrobiotus metropolitanus]|uniref:uncharacterized protein LOC129583067 isoform X2 n=1 Tax=Paramacrobiotus metropolitanus TaxID=2943436 RepID=UPI00244633B9|nr:uncharacterized protein LOC129583067 isoform X2 [Paramacrobiotus metropolitanus]
MGSVKDIYLEDNNIQRIFLSRFFVVRSLETIVLDRNSNLTDIDDRFLRSVSPASGRPRLVLGDTPLCSDAPHCQRINKIYGPLEDCCTDTAPPNHSPARPSRSTV